jgi:hypothetical protein
VVEAAGWSGTDQEYHAVAPEPLAAAKHILDGQYLRVSPKACRSSHEDDRFGGGGSAVKKPRVCLLPDVVEIC